MKNIFCFILLWISIAGFAQSGVLRNESPDNRYDVIRTSLSENKDPDSILLPFRSIEVIDATADTAKCGYIWDYARSKTVKLFLKGGKTFSINNFINHYFSHNLDKQTENSLLIITRKLWLTRPPESDGIIGSKSKLYFKAEVYLKKGELFTPLFRFDTNLFRNNTPNIYALELIEKAYTACVKRVLTIHSMTGRLALSNAVIDSFTQKTLIFPIHKKNGLKKGVYCNFNDFLNNNPCYTDFSIQHYKTGLALYIKKDVDKDELDISSWGYCDGENLFKRINTQYILLFPTGYTYEAYTPKNLQWENITLNGPGISTNLSQQYGTGGGLIGLAVGEMLTWIKTNRKTNNIRPVQLDMGTGEFY